MGTVLYNVNEDSSTDPISYYPSAVITSTLNTEAISQLINDKEPTISLDTARTGLNEFRDVCMDWLEWGYWILLEDFVQIYTELNVNFGENYMGDIVPEDLQALGDSQDLFVSDTESLITFDLNRYTFPLKPYIKSTQEKRYDTINHIVGGYGCYLYGSDFGSSMDDDETGVWMESPAGNNYQQVNNLSFTDTSIIFVPDVTGETGAAGNNSVEHLLTVRGRYEEGSPVVIGDSFTCRAINQIDQSAGENKAFLIGNQTGNVVQILNCSVETDVFLYFYSETDELYVDFGNENTETIEITGNGVYEIIVEDNSILLWVVNLTTLISNTESYGVALMDMIRVVSVFFSFVTTDSSTFSPSITKTGDLLSWDLGNGVQEIDTNSLSYTGYIDTSEKTVTIYNVDDYSLITDIDIEDCEVLSINFSLIPLTNLVNFNCGDNNITNNLLDYTSNTALEIFYCHRNEFTGSLLDFSNLTNLVEFDFQENEITSYAGGLDSCTNLELFYASSNLLTQSAVSSIIDDLWIIRVAIGSNSCVIFLSGSGNSIPTQDAIDKIEGDGAYSGDGLKDNGCIVFYNS